MNIKKLPKGTNLFRYDQLPEESKEQARIEVINDFLRSLGKDFITWNGMNKRTKAAKTKLQGMDKTQAQILRMQEDTTYCERVILSNVCNFLENGIYITYIIN